MGACASGGVNNDKYSSDFLKEIPITKLRDENYILFLESKNIFKDKYVLLRELIKNKNPLFLDENQKFLENLNSLPAHFVYISLLFLTENTIKTISTAYLLSIEKIKNKYFDTNKCKLEDLNKSDYEILKDILTCYSNIVSFQIINSALQVETTKKQAGIVNKEIQNVYGKDVFENFKKLLFVYHEDIIERYVVNFLLSNISSNSNINHDYFFRKNIDNLNHENVRRKLREIFDENYSITVDSKTGQYDLRCLRAKEKIVEKVTDTSNNPNDAISNLESVALAKQIEAVTKTNINSKDLFKDDSTLVEKVEEKKIKEEILDKNFYKTTSDYSLNTNHSANNYFSNNLDNKLYYSNPSSNKYFAQTDLNLYSSNIVSSSKPTEQNKYDYNNQSNIQKTTNNYNANNVSSYNFDSKKFDQQLFKINCLSFHNSIRRKHQAIDLEEDHSLNLFAQLHANFLAKVDEIYPSEKRFGEKILGENIAKTNKTTNEAVENILQEWYEKRNIFDFQNPRFQKEASNFTQMIWKESKQIGMGVAFSNSGNAYVVINYYPEGNTLQGFANNVGPALN